MANYQSYEIAGTKGFTMKVHFREDINETTNSSTVFVSLDVKSSTDRQRAYYPNGYIDINGKRLQTFDSWQGTHSVYITNLNTWYRVSDGPYSMEIPHNEDGTLTYDIDVHIQGYTKDGSGQNNWKVDKDNHIIQSIPINRSFTWIYADGVWKKAVPYIYTNGTWHQAIPYIYTNNKWNQCSS